MSDNVQIGLIETLVSQSPDPRGGCHETCFGKTAA